MLILVASSFSSIAFVGFDFFLIKILGVQFQKGFSAANEILGGVALGAATAIVIGGYISKRFVNFIASAHKTCATIIVTTTLETKP